MVIAVHGLLFTSLQRVLSVGPRAMERRSGRFWAGGLGGWAAASRRRLSSYRDRSIRGKQAQAGRRSLVLLSSCSSVRKGQEGARGRRLDDAASPGCAALGLSLPLRWPLRLGVGAGIFAMTPQPPLPPPVCPASGSVLRRRSSMHVAARPCRPPQPARLRPPTHARACACVGKRRGGVRVCGRA